jgi:hypothetical protein
MNEAKGGPKSPKKQINRKFNNINSADENK